MSRKKKETTEETLVKPAKTEASSEKAETTLEPVQLTLQDLQGLANVVDLACRRGAFQGADMQAVGSVFNKLTGFLAYVAKSQEEASEDTDAESK